MSFESIAQRYAQALFDLGVEQSCVPRICQQVAQFAELYAGSDQLKTVLDNPLIPEENREKIVGEIGTRLGFSTVVTSTIRLLIRRNRVMLITTISEQLALMRDESEGVVRASVVSAAPLSDSVAKRLECELEAMTGKRVVMTHNVDPSLIAGIVTRIGDTVIDGSVRSRLEALREELISHY